MINFNTTGGIAFTSPFSNTNEPSSTGSGKDQIASDNTAKKTESDPQKAAASGQKSGELTQEEVQELADLKKRDREARKIPRQCRPGFLSPLFPDRFP